MKVTLNFSGDRKAPDLPMNERTIEDALAHAEEARTRIAEIQGLESHLGEDSGLKTSTSDRDPCVIGE